MWHLMIMTRILFSRAAWVDAHIRGPMCMTRARATCLAGRKAQVGSCARRKEVDPNIQRQKRRTSALHNAWHSAAFQHPGWRQVSLGRRLCATGSSRRACRRSRRKLPRPSPCATVRIARAGGLSEFAAEFAATEPAIIWNGPCMASLHAPCTKI